MILVFKIDFQFFSRNSRNSNQRFIFDQIDRLIHFFRHDVIRFSKRYGLSDKTMTLIDNSARFEWFSEIETLCSTKKLNSQYFLKVINHHQRFAAADRTHAYMILLLS